MAAVVDFLNTIFWGYVLIYGLLAVGIYFSIRLRLIQVIHFPEMIRAVTGSQQADAAGITPFQALCTRGTISPSAPRASSRPFSPRRCRN